MREKDARMIDMMKRMALAALLVAALTLSACGFSATPPAATLTMTATNFTTHAVTVRAGDQVAFVDPSKDGARHDLYFGNHGLFIANKNGPGDLNNKAGVVFNPGDSKTYTFSKAGIYEVTCATMPQMNVIITVR